MLQVGPRFIPETKGSCGCRIFARNDGRMADAEKVDVNLVPAWHPKISSD